MILLFALAVAAAPPAIGVTVKNPGGDKGTLCAHFTSKTGLKRGDVVYVLDVDSESVARGTVLGQCSDEAVELASESPIQDAQVQESWSVRSRADGVVTTKKPIVVGHKGELITLPDGSTTFGPLFADLDFDGALDFVERCTSTEGIHTLVWSRSSTGALLHIYEYLGYDAESDCREDLDVRPRNVPWPRPMKTGKPPHQNSPVKPKPAAKSGLPPARTPKTP
jgi:hypothetical protein